MATPNVFLCHASEDNALARQIARAFHAAGIETFFDEWEIRAGESIRQRIDNGLKECTHFVVLLTPQSIAKEWVKVEIDAGFIRKINGQSAFVPLRHGLTTAELTPLLATLLSPSLDDYDAGIKRLIDDIHGVSLKPPLGPVPSTATSPLNGASGFSVSAENIATLFVSRSVNGRTGDPHLSIEELRETGYTDDQIIEGVEELRQSRLVEPTRSMCENSFGYLSVRPTDLLFHRFDHLLMGWHAEKDADRVAIEIVNSGEQGAMSHDLADKLAWAPRRLNPALSYLIARNLVTSSKALDSVFVTSYVLATAATKRFARSRQ